MPLKLIATDIDGTLVKDGSTQLNKEYYGVLDTFRNHGVTVVIASGRQYHSIRTMFAPFAETGEFWVIAEGGALVYHNDELVCKQVIPEPLVEDIIADSLKLKRKGCDIMLSTPEGAFCPYEDSELYRWMTQSYKYEMTAAGSFRKLPTKDIVKVSIYHPFDCEKAVKGEFYDKWSEKLQLSGAGVWWMDCVMPTASKGDGLRYIKEVLDVRKSEVVAFGDNINDIPMLGLAGTSYAVANARPETISFADGVVGPYWEDGVLERLKMMVSQY